MYVVVELMKDALIIKCISKYNSIAALLITWGITMGVLICARVQVSRMLRLE